MIQYYNVRGTKIACWVNDAGFVPGRIGLVFIPGSGRDHTVWQEQCGALQLDFNIAALDLPGHGFSEGEGEDSVSQYADWVKDVTGAVGFTKPVLVGHSLGAAVCLEFATRYGDLVSAIVAVGAGVRMPVNPLIIKGIREDFNATMMMTLKFAVSKSNRDRVAPILTEGIASIRPAVILKDFMACDSLELGDRISSIKVPALALCGAEDKMTPVALSKFIAEHIPGGKFAEIEGAGHYVMLERPAVFNKVLVDFISNLYQ